MKIALLLLVQILLWSNQASAGDIGLLTVNDLKDGSVQYSTNIQIFIFMTLLTLLPAILMSMTAFTRVMIVLVILRQAIGMATTPTNQILIGISLMLTLYIMSPVMSQINEVSVQPYLSEKITSMEAINRSEKPIRNYLRTGFELIGHQGSAEASRLRGWLAA